MTKLGKKFIAYGVLTAFLLSSGGAFAATAKTTTTAPKATATPKVIKLIYNNQELKNNIAPVMIKDSVYVPLRFVSESFGKKVNWVGSAYSVYITDGLPTTTTPPATSSEVTALNQTIQTLQGEVAQKNVQILLLEAEIKKLKEEANTSNYSLSKLEDDLIDEYGTYRNIKFKIALSGDKDDVKVDIQVDLSDYKSKWNGLSNSYKTTYLQNICDDIISVYKNASIKGEVRDSSRSGKPVLLTFKTNSSNKVSFSEKNDLSSLESDLNDDYSKYFSGIRLSIELDGDEDDIEYTVNIDLDDYSKEWKEITTSQRTKLMRYIYEDIQDEYEDADIEGTIYDTDARKTIATYYKTSGGSDRYSE